MKTKTHRNLFSILLTAFILLIATYAWGYAAEPNDSPSRIPNTPQQGLNNDWRCWGISSEVACNRKLYALDMVSATDFWAVGDETIVHWDGAVWVDVSQPPVVLNDVDMVSATQGWAVGQYG
ncbi:MAG: hypothetical protein GY803_11635, partial [Chloroflexi bacterium]|nr:hypothetical protein [Chloroflexota bacterium]